MKKKVVKKWMFKYHLSFKKISNYQSNNKIHLNVFEFSQNITFPKNIFLSKDTLRIFFRTENTFRMLFKFKHFLNCEFKTFII